MLPSIMQSSNSPLQFPAASPPQPRRYLLLRVVRLALPVILTNLLQSVVNVVDVFMVGRLGPIPIAAIGMSNVIRMLVLVLVLTVAAGAMSLVAQAKGARDPERMSFVTRQSISSGLLLSVVLTAAGLVLAEPLLRLANSGGDPQAVALGVQFLHILFWGMPFLVLNIIFNRLMQGAGDTLTPLLLTGSLNLLNIAFNYLFMFGPGPLPAFGLPGAAMGTVLARGLAALIGFLVIRSGKNVIRLLPGSYRPNPGMFQDIFSIGIPSGIQGVFRNGSRLLVISVLTSTEVGTYGAAALAIGLQVESLAFMPVLAINVAATSLVGQSLGSWQVEDARQRGNIAIAMGVLLMVTLITPIVILAPQIIHLFDPSAHPVLAAAGTTYLRLNTLFLPISAVSMVANGALRGAGDTVPAMLSTLFNRGVLTVLLAYVLAFPLGLGSQGVWYALVIGLSLDGFFIGLRWRGRTWLRVALHKTELYRRHLHRLSEDIQGRYLREIRMPLMGQPETREQVEAERVVYQLPGQQVEIRFEESGYQVL